MKKITRVRRDCRSLCKQIEDVVEKGDISLGEFFSWYPGISFKVDERIKRPEVLGGVLKCDYSGMSVTEEGVMAICDEEIVGCVFNDATREKMIEFFSFVYFA